MLTQEQRRAHWRKYNKSEKGKTRNIKSYYKRRELQYTKIRCRELARESIKRGKITRLSCEICGDLSTHAHHEDYTKPFEIVWLCRNHHKQLHDKREQEVARGATREPCTSAIQD